MMRSKYKVLKNYITAGNISDILRSVEKSIQKKSFTLIAPLASYTLALAYFDKKIEKTLNTFTYLLADSHWIRIAINFLYGIGLKERITGTDLMLTICKLAQGKKYAVSLYGTTDSTLKALKRKLRQLYPNLRIVYTEPSKFRQLTVKEKQQFTQKLRVSETKILFVALGSPRQEIFSSRLLYEKPMLDMPIIIIPVGAAFDFVSGVKPESPRLLKKVGFEWLFRLVCEPRRLSKRYLLYGPLFAILIILQKITGLTNLRND